VLLKVQVFIWGIFELVGHSEEVKDTCGMFRRLMGCLGRDGSHDRVDVYGHKFHDKVALQKTFMRCYSPRCKVCYGHGWAKRLADRGTARLLKLSERFGLIEHGTVSIPLKDVDRVRGMSRREFNVYWKYIEGILVALGVLGGIIMFHPARYNPVDGWHWSPHFHWLGVVVPSYGRCRRCTKKVCRGRGSEFEKCDGFDARVRRENRKSGLIIRVFGKRGKVWKMYRMDGEVVRVPTEEDNVHGTLMYQLSHAGLVNGGKRAVVVHWFGVARGLKVTVAKRKQLCPICDEEFVHIRRLSVCFDGVVGLGVHIVDGLDADGNSRYVEAFAGG
jgi:hypothetical protein